MREIRFIENITSCSKLKHTLKPDPMSPDDGVVVWADERDEERYTKNQIKTLIQGGLWVPTSGPTPNIKEITEYLDWVSDEEDLDKTSYLDIAKEIKITYVETNTLEMSDDVVLDLAKFVIWAW